MSETLEFDVLDHEYTLGGRKLPSVTQIIGSQFPLLNIPQAALEFARQMGVAIHSACELYDIEKLDWSTLDLKVVPYVKAWQRARDQLNLEIVDIEVATHHRLLFYAGRVDRVIKLNGVLGVLDLKRPILNDRAGVQTCAYMHALNTSNYRHGRIVTRFAIQLRSDGSYRLRQYKDESDWSVFTAALTIHNWRKSHDI